MFYYTSNFLQHITTICAESICLVRFGLFKYLSPALLVPQLGQKAAPEAGAEVEEEGVVEGDPFC